MNLPTEIAAHITVRAEAAAKTYARNAVRLISEEIQKSGDITITAPSGGTMVLNVGFIESLELGIASSCLDRMKKDELEIFVRNSEELIEERAKEKGKKQPAVITT